MRLIKHNTSYKQNTKKMSLVMKPLCLPFAPTTDTTLTLMEDQANAIEGLLYEALPSIKKNDAETLARRLSILLAKQSSGCLMKGPITKEQLKRLCMRLLRVAREKRRTSLSLLDAAEETSSIDNNTKPALFPPLNTKAKVERHHELINVVGEANYNEILEVTNKIKDIRKRSSLWTKYSHHFADSLKVEEERLPASQGLPTAISDIYFRTRLVDVMRVVDSTSTRTLQETPPPCACIVKKVDWDYLLRDAKEKLHAFCTFEQENALDVDQGALLLCACSGVKARA